MRSNRTKYVIVDIDGTIADVRHRLHHIKGPKKKNWKAFFEEMYRDEPITDRLEQVRELSSKHQILSLRAGRSNTGHKPSGGYEGTKSHTKSCT